MNLMKNHLALLALAALAGTASAQTRIEKPLRVQLNAVFPSSSLLRDAISDVGIGFGLSYDFYQTPITVGRPYIRGGAYIDGSFLSGNGIENNVYAFGVQGRIYFANQATTSFYALAGLGVYFNTVSGSGSNDDKTRFGGKLALGAEFSRSLYGEFGVNILPKLDGINTSFFTASIGYRF